MSEMSVPNCTLEDLPRWDLWTYTKLDVRSKGRARRRVSLAHFQSMLAIVPPWLEATLLTASASEWSWVHFEELQRHPQAVVSRPLIAIDCHQTTISERRKTNSVLQTISDLLSYLVKDGQWQCRVAVLSDQKE